MMNNRTRHWQTLFLGVLFALLAMAAGRTAAGADSTADDGRLLLFEARTIDTTASIINSQAATTADGMALHIIQFTGPVRDDWLEAIEATGAELVHYVSNNGYLVWAGESSRGQLDRLAAGSDFLRFSAPYSADLKPDRSLRLAQTQVAADAEIDVIIQMLRHEGSYQTEKMIDGLIGKQLGGWEPVLNYQNMRAVIAPSAIEAIAALPDVVWLGVYQAPQLMDEKQAQILAGNLNQDQTRPAGAGYLEWLKNRGFSEDPRMYPIIDITDSGIGNGNAGSAAGDRTFRVEGSPGQASRLTYLTNCTQESNAGGPDGHGHLNASIAGGYDRRSGDPYRDDGEYQRGLGVNPFGRIAGTRVFDFPIFDNSRCGGSQSPVQLIQGSYQAGARISSNSWGCTTEDCARLYTPFTQAYDAAVRDADPSTPGNQEMLIIFSAGNAGSLGPQTMGAPANGKNVVAVGASENVRPAWTDGCGLGPSDANNLQDIATYSSRGPAPGGRNKPDLVAPGTHIVGTASTSPDYNGAAVCDAYYPNGQTIFAASSGTSHSAPAVAGFASLASFWLNAAHGIEHPSPALLKAFLVASSSYLTGTDAGDDLPNNDQGFGLPNMNRAFGPGTRLIVEQGQAPLFDVSGQFWKLKLRPVDSKLPVRIVMAFTDYPGALGMENPRVNDLNLEVIRRNKRYLGNKMDGQWSQPGGLSDKVNTIEAVYFPAGETSSFEVRVRAANIAGDGVPGVGDKTDQDFALVCDNCRHDTTIDYKYHAYLPALLP